MARISNHVQLINLQIILGRIKIWFELIEKTGTVSGKKHQLLQFVLAYQKEIQRRRGCY